MMNSDRNEIEVVTVNVRTYDQIYFKTTDFA